ncbi:MAG: zf-HC2 domain-containing protein [Magnetococcus sp. WYHC-3]
MKCDPELVSAFLDDELDSMTLQVVIEHLLRCDNCQQTLTLLSSARDTLHQDLSSLDCDQGVRHIMGSIFNEEHAPAPGRTVFKSLFRQLTDPRKIREPNSGNPGI